MIPDVPGIRLGALLGEGGTGRVYAGEKDGLPVAVKIVDAQIARDKGFAQRFLDTNHALRELHHPGLPMVHEVGLLLDGAPYAVMEQLEGRDLGTVLTLEGALTYRKAARIGALAADALACAHAAGLLHLDVKPGNVLLIGDGRVKLLDFLGAAGSPNSAPLGVPEYWSPEVAAGGHVDERSDIYSLGVVLFEALAGEPPFRSHSQGQLVSKHLREAPARLRAPTGRPPIPDGLRAVVDKCLAKNPAERYQSAAELTAELRSLSGAYTPAPTAQADAPAGTPPAGVPIHIPVEQNDLTGRVTRSPSRPSITLPSQVPPARGSRWAIIAGGAALVVGAVAILLAFGGPTAAHGSTVRLTLSSSPSGAEVFLDGQRVLGKTATTVELPRSTKPVSLEFRAAGRPPMRVEVIPDRAGAVHAEWEQGQ